MVILIERNETINKIFEQIKETKYQVIIIEHETLFDRDTGLLKENKNFKEMFSKLIQRNFIIEFIIISQIKSPGQMMQEWKDEGILLPLLEKPVMNKIFFEENLKCYRRDNFVQITSDYSETLHNLINDKIYHETFENKITVNLIVNSLKRFIFYSMKFGEEKRVNTILFSNATLKLADLEYSLEMVKELTLKNKCTRF